MNTFLSNSRFTEYNATPGGRYLIKVDRKYQNQWITIGYIHREYNKENKKSTYRATDFQGGQIFADFNDLYVLKRKFIEHGESLAIAVPIRINNAKMLGKLINSQKPERTNALKNIREKNAPKEKTKEVSKTSPKGKVNNDQKEKEQDSKNPVKYKIAEPGKEENKPKENEQEVPEANTEKQVPNEPVNNEVAEREVELDQIREQNDDLEQNIDLDM
jgi:hypothetical protein